MQEFSIDKKFRWQQMAALVIFLGFFLLGAVLLIIPSEGDRNPGGTIMISVLCMGLFGTLALISWKTFKRLPYTAIAADAEGLWYRHEGKAKGLLRWEDIGRIRERAVLQCLDIIDRSGRRRIRAEYQLNGFETLRGLLSAKMRLSPGEARQREFARGICYHLFYAAAILLFAWLGLYAGQNGNPLLGYGGMALVVVIFYEYLGTVHRLEISDQGLTVHYPLRRKFISYAAILRIEMADSFYKGARRPEVRVFARNAGKPYRLKQLGVDANVLYKALNRALESAADAQTP